MRHLLVTFGVVIVFTVIYGGLVELKKYKVSEVAKKQPIECVVVKSVYHGVTTWLFELPNGNLGELVHANGSYILSIGSKHFGSQRERAVSISITMGQSDLTSSEKVTYGIEQVGTVDVIHLHIFGKAFRYNAATSSLLQIL